MPGKYRKEGPAVGPDAASLDTWAAWAGLGAPTDEYPARRGAHRQLTAWERLQAAVGRVLGRAPSRV